MATQREDAEHAYEQVRQSVRAGDRLMASVANEVDRAFRTSGIGVGTISQNNRATIMRAIDPALWQFFGRTRREASSSELYQLIQQRSLIAGRSQYQRAWDELDGIMRRSDPVLWGRMQGYLQRAPLDERDGLMTAYRMLYGPHVEQQRLAQSKILDPLRSWVPEGRHNMPGGYRLSDRGWQAGQHIRSAIDQRIVDAIRNGEDAIRVARELEQYLNPEAAPVQYRKDGRIIRKNMTGAPRGGHGSTWTRRLMRTEISRVQGDSTVRSAADVPGIRGIKWRLSARHQDHDECDVNATQDLYGLGPGIYPIDRVPRHPNHPQDICLLLHDHHSREYTRALIVNKYRSIALGDMA